MRNRLKRSEREAVRNRYATSELLYKVISKPARELEREMSHFRFSVEELFLEVMSIIDNIKEVPQEAVGVTRDLWDTLYCDLRDLDTADSPEEEIKTATSEIVYTALLLLSCCEGALYGKLVFELSLQLGERHPGALDRIQVMYMPDVWRIGEEKLRIRIQEYMASEEWISDDIREMFENLPSETQSVGDNTKEVAKNDSALTNRQLAILFEHLLNVSLQPGYTNIKAFSQLLAEVSGRSAGSIRQTIMKGVDYESSNVHADIDRIEALIRPISERIADTIKNSKEEK